jgi:hypothetical protein
MWDGNVSQEMLDMDNIAYDINNNEYFCKLCGKAGFKNIASVRGHLANCPNNQKKIEKYRIILPDEVKEVLKGSFSNIGADAGAGAGAAAAPKVNVDNDRLLQVVVAKLDNMNKRLALLEKSIHNENNHLSQVQVKTNGLDWNKLLLGTLILFGAYFLYRAGKMDTLGSVMIRKGLEGLDF